MRRTCREQGKRIMGKYVLHMIERSIKQGGKVKVGIEILTRKEARKKWEKTIGKSGNPSCL
jgi:hypothetical protein